VLATEPAVGRYGAGGYSLAIPGASRRCVGLDCLSVIGAVAVCCEALVGKPSKNGMVGSVCKYEVILR